MKIVFWSGIKANHSHLQFADVTKKGEIFATFTILEPKMYVSTRVE